MSDRALLLMLDGVGDRSHASLNGQTPLQASVTPNLDKLASRGMCGIHYPLYPGACTGSDLAHWSILGYPHEEYPGRALLHGWAAGVTIAEGEVALMGNIIPTRRDGDALFMRRDIKFPEELCRKWTILLEGISYQNISFEPHYLWKEEVLLVLKGKASFCITDSDPFFPHLPILEVQPLEDSDDKAGAQVTAEAVNHFLREARNRLSSVHPDAAFITKWASRELSVEPFSKRWGLKAAIISSGPLYHGLALKLGMKSSMLKPASSPGEDLSVKLEEARLLFQEGLELVIVHTKETDEASHSGNPINKVRVLEELDAAIELFPDIFDDDDILKIVTGDHSTSSEIHPRLIHSGEPVPLIMAGKRVRRDGVVRFDEVSCAQGALGLFKGRYLMSLILNFLNRACFHSSRPLPRQVPFLPMEGKPLLFS